MRIIINNFVNILITKIVGRASLIHRSGRGLIPTGNGSKSLVLKDGAFVVWTFRGGIAKIYVLTCLSVVINI
jgi:hypothetical protein